MPSAEKSHLALLKKFFVLTKAFFNGAAKRQARLWLSVLLGLCVAVGVVQVFMSYVSRDFVTSLEQRDHAGWVRGLWKFIGVCCLSLPVGVFYTYARERLSLAWRRWMTQILIKRYFFNRAYYRIRISESVDNPDQRIAEDVAHFTTSVLNYFLIIVNSVVSIVGFLGVLWLVSGKLVGVLFIYAAIGTVVSILFGRRLVSLYFNQYQKEASFRYSLIRVRDNAESIAFFRGEKRCTAPG